MRKILKNKNILHPQNDQAIKRIMMLAISDEKTIYELLNTSKNGLTQHQVEEARITYGNNIVDNPNQKTVFKALFYAFINPFTCILIMLGIVSFVCDVVMVSGDDRNYVSVIIISTMVILSGLLRFTQERKSDKPLLN